MIDKRFILWGAVGALVLAGGAYYFYSKYKKDTELLGSTKMIELSDDMSMDSMSENATGKLSTDFNRQNAEKGSCCNRGNAAYYSAERAAGQSTACGPGSSGSAPCGAGGDMTGCGDIPRKMAFGENSSIYALHNGTLHDPRLKTRMCGYGNKRITCQPGAAGDVVEHNGATGSTADTLTPFDDSNLKSAYSGSDQNDLSVAYGYEK